MVLSQSPDMGYTSLRQAILNSATKIPSAGSSMVSSGGCVNAYEALLAESGLDTSMKAAQEPSQATDTSTTVASASDGGGGGGGGCLIETSHASTGTCASAILLMITIVLFQVIRRKDLE
jgi:hypothetical protein